ncbi:MAG: ACP phosphodiesterase [Deltaproteobacteria bacterium CG11_big_fil_rev_8_21_14_0_20_49_13]|nr:MAG: ACP phosphodiesterase [Deltaproteobacteria bacterium CG11_big_fil_rev_8_21_14_0_20_49_13]
MKKILHLIATPRGEDSRTLKVSTYFLSEICKKYPKCEIDEFNVFSEELPELTVKRVEGKYFLLGGKDMPEDVRISWNEIVKQIDRFMSADTVVISAPMWNFSIPYRLKQYIDVIVQPKYLFRYTDKGVEGLAKGKEMVVVTSRGGDYGGGNPSDHQESYLRTVFEFIGIKDITFINVQPMDAMGPEVQAKKTEEAKKIAGELAGKM